MTKREQIAGLKDWLVQYWGNCERCKLHKYRNKIVLGDFGPSPIMLLGEAPGAQENQQGKPFVGAAGKKLRTLAKQAGLRIESISIVNTLACRPPNNRDPELDELEACQRRLFGIFRALDPTLIVLLGRVPAQWALKRNVRVTAERGIVANARFPGDFKNRRTLITLHPAYLLRNPITEADFVVDLRIAAQWARW